LPGGLPCAWTQVQKAFDLSSCTQWLLPRTPSPRHGCHRCGLPFHHPAVTSPAVPLAHPLTSFQGPPEWALGGCTRTPTGGPSPSPPHSHVRPSRPVTDAPATSGCCVACVGLPATAFPHQATSYCYMSHCIDSELARSWSTKWPLPALLVRVVPPGACTTRNPRARLPYIRHRQPHGLRTASRATRTRGRGRKGGHFRALSSSQRRSPSPPRTHHHHPIPHT
jgi:hypothetical protein